MQHDTTKGNPEWETHKPLLLSRTTWLELMQNKVPLLMIPEFASAAECSLLLHVANEIGFNQYENVYPSIDRIGVSVFEYNLNRGPRAYFNAARRLQSLQRQIFAKAFDPVDRFMEILHKVLGVTVHRAVDPNGHEFYAGLIRKIENGTLLHIDYAPAEQPGWAVSNVTAQFSWNVYLRLDSIGPGETHIYNRPWEPRLEQFKIPSTYGYQRDVIDGVEKVTFRPEVGNVYIFNTKNFHEVERSNGARVTVTSAVGVTPSGDIILWS